MSRQTLLSTHQEMSRHPSTSQQSDVSDEFYNYKDPANPYLTLSNELIDAIILEREVSITGSRQSKAYQLLKLDKVLPYWINSIKELTPEMLYHAHIELHNLHVYAAIHNVTIPKSATPKALNHEDISELREYVALSLMIRNNNLDKRIVDATDANVLKLILQDIDVPNIEFANTETLRRLILHTETPDDLMILQNRAQRYNTLKNSKPLIFEKLYGTDDFHHIVKYEDVHPLEPTIIHLDSFPLNKLIESLGIIIPPHYAKKDRKKYLEDNIALYKDVWTRTNFSLVDLNVLMYCESDYIKGYLNRLTDQEIFNYVGFYVPYVDRTSLIHNMTQCFTEKRFIIPIKDLNHSLNKETIMGNSISDPDVFKICYGTPLSYYTYEMDDFIGSFYLDKKTQEMEFRMPNNINALFKLQEIEWLRQLLEAYKCNKSSKGYPSKEQLTELNRLIVQCMAKREEKNNADRVLMRKYNGFTIREKNLIQDFLLKIFFTGMYMRKWKGPPHPYPLKEEDTGRDTEKEMVDLPDAAVTDAIHEVQIVLAKMNKRIKAYCMGIRTCEYKQEGDIIKRCDLFGELWHRVVTYDFCIRTASSMFVGTAYHYTRILCNAIIPGVYVSEIDRIQ
jgi:hypothetical protein